MKSVLVTGLSVLATLTLSSCSAFKNMDEMKDTTNKMSATTDTMSKTTEGLSQTTASTYRNLRQGNTKDLRASTLKEMAGKDDIVAKLADAGVYFKAFEFQVWTGAGEDDATKRDYLFAAATKEYLFSIQNYIDDKTFEDVAPTHKDQRSLNLYALAAAVHEINDDQIIMARRNGFTEISLLQLIERGLAYRADVNSGAVNLKNIPMFAQNVLDNADVAVYLLKVRFNFLAAAPLAKVSNLETSWAPLRIFNKLGKALFNWTSQVDSLDVAQIDDLNMYLGEALRTQSVVQSLGFDCALDSDVRKVYSHMKFKDLTQSDVQVSAAQLNQIEIFKGNVSKLLQE